MLLICSSLHNEKPFLKMGAKVVNKFGLESLLSGKACTFERGYFCLVLITKTALEREITMLTAL